MTTSHDSIRAVMISYLKEHNMRQFDFARISGINRGILSKIMNGQIITVQQLEKLTDGMNLERGSLDDLLVKEFRESKFDWRRTKSLIVDFSKKKRYNLVKEVVDICLEDIQVRSNLFLGAEEFYQEGSYTTAEILYNAVLSIERSTYSERLCVSLYRLMKIHKNDTVNNLEYAIQFKPYRDRLPDDKQLDGLITLAHVYGVRDQWDEVKIFATQMQALSHSIYESKRYKDDDFNPDRPLVYYYGQSYLIQGTMYEVFGDYKKSLQMIEKYEDLSWFEGLDENGRNEVDKLSNWASANKLSISIKSGDQGRISDYTAYLKERATEVITGLTSLLESSIKYSYSIDDILEEFKPYYDSDTQESQQFEVMNKAAFLHYYSIYLFNKEKYNEGMIQCLKSIELSVKLNNQKGILDAIIVFELYSEYASEKQLSAFKILIKEVYHEKKMVLSTD